MVESERIEKTCVMSYKWCSTQEVLTEIGQFHGNKNDSQKYIMIPHVYEANNIVSKYKKHYYIELRGERKIHNQVFILLS